MVELALTPDFKWDATAAQIAEACGVAGFAALGISAGAVDERSTAAFRRAGIRCHELVVLWIDGAPDAIVRSAEDLVPAAEQIGAEWVLAVFGDDDPTPATMRSLERCATVLGEVGAGVAVEFTPESALSTIGDALEVVHALRPHGRTGLVIDTWHFTMGESTWEDLEAVPIDDIAYIQFDDVLPPESESFRRETMHHRGLPGEGVADLDRFATTLLERGWDGTVSVEVLSAALRERPLPELVQVLHDASVGYWR